MEKQTWSFLPKSKSGKWSVGLIILMPILFVVGSFIANWFYPSVSAGDMIFADIAARPALALTMLAGMVAGILALITGLVGIARNKEKAVLVYISSLIGALLLVFLIAEIIFPH